MEAGDLKHFGEIVKQTGDAIFSTDENFLIKTWNIAAENLYGYTYNEALGVRLGVLLKMLMTEEQKAQQLQELQKVGFYQGEYEVYNKWGIKKYVLASISVLREGEHISGYVAIHRDIDERKKLEDSLKLFNTNLENEVKRKNKQLTDIFERITDAFVAINKEGYFTYVNKKAGEFFGREPGSYLNKSLWEEFPGTMNKMYEACQYSLLHQQHVQLTEYYLTTKKWYESHIYPSTEGLSIFFRDITEVKQIEEQAKLSNQRLLLHLTNSPLAVLEWDKNQIITSWSNNAEALFGWNEYEVVGQNVKDIELVYKDDEEEVGGTLSLLLNGDISSAKVINRNKTKHGKIITCEWHNSILTDADGNVMSCMSLVQDISARIKAEEELMIRQQHLNTIYNAGSDVIFLLDVEQKGRYKFIWINEAFKYGTALTNEQIINKYVEEVIPEPPLQVVLEKYAEVLDKQKTVQWEDVYKYSWGTKYGLVNITPIFDNKNVCIRLVGSVHDITELKKAEQELKDKNEQLRNLTAHLQDIREDERANIAREIHDELGARLTGIRLDISWIQNQLESSENQVNNKFPALIQLVDDTIKTVRKISTELRPSILDDFGIADALEWQALEFTKRTGINCSVKSFLVNNTNNKKIDITLFRIFQESLTNILRHSQAKNVCAQLLEHNNIIELIITDDGVGMDMEAVKDKRTLGLIGMKERVFMVNGDCNITSEIGKGTTITVSIPNA